MNKAFEQGDNVTVKGAHFGDGVIVENIPAVVFEDRGGENVRVVMAFPGNKSVDGWVLRRLLARA